MQTQSDPIHKLSKHLFWDVDKELLDFEKNKRFIVERVLEYGLMNDWRIIYFHYGINEIAKVAMASKILDKKNISFILALSNIPKEKFLCYSTKQSTIQHWNY